MHYNKQTLYLKNYNAHKKLSDGKWHQHFHSRPKIVVSFVSFSTILCLYTSSSSFPCIYTIVDALHHNINNRIMHGHHCGLVWKDCEFDYSKYATTLIPSDNIFLFSLFNLNENFALPLYTNSTTSTIVTSTNVNPHPHPHPHPQFFFL